LKIVEVGISFDWPSPHLIRKVVVATTTLPRGWGMALPMSSKALKVRRPKDFGRTSSNKNH